MFENGQNSTKFSIRNFVDIFRKNWLKVLGGGVLGGLLALLITLIFMTPKYEANIDLLVNQKSTNEQTQYNVQQADLQAINTYKDVLKKSVVLTPVLREIKKRDNYNGNLETLQNSVTVSNETNSQVLGVSVTSDNAYTAADTANIIGQVFNKKIKKMMKIDNVTVVTKAKPNLNPISPNKILNIFIGIVLGLLLGLVWAIVRDLLDTSVKNESFIVNDLGLVNLGFVGHLTDDSDRKIVSVQRKSLSSEKKRRI